MCSVTIGVRLRSSIGFNAFWKSLVSLDKYGSRILYAQGYSAVEGARYIFRSFLAGEGTHLLLLDDDAVLHPATITRLLSRKLPVVGGLTWTGGLPTEPTIYRGFMQVYQGKFPSWCVRHDDVRKWILLPDVQNELLQHQLEAGYVTTWDGPEALSRADAIGFHCVLIQRDVLERIGEPYCESNDIGVREDFDFSERAIRAGFDLYVDKTVIVGHVIAHPIRPLDYYVYAFAKENQV